MTSKRDYELLRRKVLHEAYTAYLADEGKQASMLEAEVFAVRCHNEQKMFGFSEREIIQILAGRLPFGY
jgi:hypothetical protein